VPRPSAPDKSGCLRGTPLSFPARKHAIRLSTQSLFFDKHSDLACSVADGKSQNLAIALLKPCFYLRCMGAGGCVLACLRACAAGDAADSQFSEETIRLRARPALSFALFFQVQAPPASSILLILSLSVFQYPPHCPSLSNESRSVRVPVFR